MEKIIQFGTGNFLRGFVDSFVDILNEKGLYDGKIVIVKPTNRGSADALSAQNCVYNLYLRGIENGQEVSRRREIHSISRVVNPYTDFEGYLSLAKKPDFRFIVSNTTEAGIAFDETCEFCDAPALSFPGKLTQLLYARYKAALPGFVILPCELIDNNAEALLTCVLQYVEKWNLGADFAQWVQSENAFCNTLVDRIVTGFPVTEVEELYQEIGYNDQLLDTAEVFHLWVIEGDFEHELPLRQAGFNVVWTNDVAPYKKMKVRVLNGAHTSTVFPALLCGVETVGESLRDDQLRDFLHTNLNKYILPMLGDTAETRAFADSVLERFQNPYIRHLWKSIALNSVSKFTVRVLPTMLDYVNTYGEVPKTFALSLAALIFYYKNNEVSDNPTATVFIKTESVESILANASLWGADLTAFAPVVKECFDKITTDGIREALAWTMC